MAISGEDIGRPLTHDLLLSVIDETGSELTRIEITKLAEGTFFALMYLERDGETLEIDARPSDAIAVALRAGAPIFVADDVLAKAQVIDETVEHDEQDLEKFKDLLGGIDLGEEDLE
jgi:uncharacterized protein